MYKFFDQDGNILSLRMDMTVPIARVVQQNLKTTNSLFDFIIPAMFLKSENLLRENEMKLQIAVLS